MNVATPFTAFQLVRYTIFFWMALKREIQDMFIAKSGHWINEYNIVGAIHPRISIKEIWEFSRQVARKILKENSEKLVSELTPEQLMDYVLEFLSQNDPNLPEWQIVSLLKPRYIELSELICQYQKTSADFGDECPNGIDVLHFNKSIKQLCSEDVWNELVNQAISVYLHETFGSFAVINKVNRVTAVVMAHMHGEAIRHLKRSGLM